MYEIVKRQTYLGECVHEQFTPPIRAAHLWAVQIIAPRIERDHGPIVVLCDGEPVEWRNAAAQFERVEVGS